MTIYILLNPLPELNAISSDKAENSQNAIWWPNLMSLI